MRTRATRVLAALLAAACGPAVTVEGEPSTGDTGPASTGGRDDGAPGTSADGTDGAADAVDAADETTRGSTDSDDADATGLPSTSDSSGSETAASSGCGKVDFLVIVDNSGSMADEQERLQAAFPTFIDAVVEAPGGPDDVHVLVTDVDAYVFEGCDAACACELDGGCTAGAPRCQLPCAIGLQCSASDVFECGVTTPLACEDVLGAGIVHPRGDGASNEDCAFQSGARYIDASEPDLAAAFACAAGVGTGSFAGTERPMQAMAAAVAPVGEAFACNAGWLRDDAMLVVVFITDEDDGEGDSAGDPEAWRHALTQAKGGDPSAVVVLGLFGDNDLPDAICTDLVENMGAEAAPRLREFVDSWGDQGLAGSICAESYDGFFSEAALAVEATCAGFAGP